MNARPTFEPYRVILDYEALEDGFLDRIEDLNTTFDQIDAAAGFTRGNTQKLLSKSRERWARTLGIESMGKMLKGTGMALVLVVDDERFAPIRAELTPRKRPMPAAAARIKKTEQQMAELKAQLLKDHMKDIGAKGNQNGAASNGGKRRAKLMKKRARQRSASHAARMRWAKRVG